MLKKLLILITFIIVIYIGYSLYQYSLIKQKSQKNKHIDQIKNGLLSYALLKTANKDDLKNFDMNYKNFDGTRLPMFSGYSTSNACLSYIIDKDEFKKCQFYTPIMEDKIVAIEKYLEKNFDSDKKVEEFFNKFIEQIEGKELSNEPESNINEVIEEPIEIKGLVDAETKSIPINISCETVATKIKSKIVNANKKKALVLSDKIE